MKLTMIGSGYVGLTTGTCFAEVGHHIICVDNNDEKIAKLQQGIIPIYEPGLEELVLKNVQEGRLSFSNSIADSVKDSEVIFIAVPTPPQPDGSVDLSFMEKVAREIAINLKPEWGYKVIVDKSTVPVKTGENVLRTIKTYAPKGVDVDVVSNPEFLREGCAVDDLLNPDRIVVGADTEKAAEVMRRVYSRFEAPFILTDVYSAELIKHAANSFLALKISYINAISAICEKTGADVQKVAYGIGLDKRIGRDFLNAGLGYGGSCFPKDIKAFIAISEKLGIPFDLLKDVETINARQAERFLDRIRERLWMLKDKKIAVWGLAFKQNTDDIRESVSIKLCQALLKEGAILHVHDPKALDNTRDSGLLEGNITYHEKKYDALPDAEVLIVATEWPDYARPNPERIKNLMLTPIIFDGRNIMDMEELAASGIEYHCIGRPSLSSPNA